jgi:hypothetical protein
MALGDRVRELDEQVAAAVRRTIDDLRGEMRRRLDEATVDLQRRLSEVAPELPRSFVSEEHLRQIAEEAASPSGEALQAARAQGRDEARDEARREAHGELRAALFEIDRARSQSDVLQRLLDTSAHHAPRAAILLLRDGRLAGWGARGFGTAPEAARSVSLPADEAPWSAVAGGGAPTGVPGARCAALVSQLDSALPKEGCLVPLVLRERVAAVVYADRPGEDDPLDVDALQVLTYAAALALETLAFREREATATLMPATGTGAAPAASEVHEAPEAPYEPSVEIEEEPELAAVELEAAGVAELEEVDEIEPESFEVTEEPAASAAGLSEVEELAAETELDLEELGELEPIGFAPEPEDAAAGGEIDVELPAGEPYAGLAEDEEAPLAAGQEGARPDEVEEAETPATSPHGDDLLTRRHDYLQAVEEADAQAAQAAGTGEAIDEGALEETDLEEAPELEEPAAEEEEEPAEQPSGPIPWRTETRESTAVSPPPGEPEVEEPAEGEEEVEERPEAGAVPFPPPKPAGAGGAVEPPADVEGPGWAFSAAREPVAKHEEAAHEEARRLARLLVSEIQLYNQDEVEEGRRNRDVYERLKDDIDRSRQLYEERVDPGVRETTDYFYQELVRQLAAGDAKALGI